MQPRATTMSMHKLVGARQLACMQKGAPCPAHEVTITVTKVHNTRTREFHPSSVVFNVEGVDAAHDVIHLYFYDSWAAGASFISAGDEVTLRGLVVHDWPTVAGAAPAAPLPTWYVTPLDTSAELASELAVVQPGEQGDRMEVCIKAPHFDVPSIRCKVRGAPPAASGPSSSPSSGGVVFVNGGSSALPEKEAP